MCARAGDLNAYYYTPAWRAKRQVCIDRYCGRCAYCGNKAVQAHHKTYKRFGHERQSDLVAVCVRCHKVITIVNRIKRRIGL